MQRHASTRKGGFCISLYKRLFRLKVDGFLIPVYPDDAIILPSGAKRRPTPPRYSFKKVGADRWVAVKNKAGKAKPKRFIIKL